ncbi:hypothetical protein BDZ91DRAFT_407850 [Kalaharituber pfeilii]|nr:hypothetical protein BDZ91DRAFT_407850 [Kalaharituber pfeilii]
MRQPGITAAGPSASGNVPTRFPSSRLGTNQQPGAGTPNAFASSGRSGLMACNTETLLANGRYTATGNNPIRSVPSSNQSSLETNMFESNLSEFCPLVSNAEPAGRSTTTSTTAQRYQDDLAVENLSLQLAQFTPAPPPTIQPGVGESTFSRNNTELSRTPAGNSAPPQRRLTRTPSAYIQNHGVSIAASQSGMAFDHTSSAKSSESSGNPDMSSHLRKSNLFTQSAMLAPEDNTRSSPMSKVQSTASIPFGENGTESFSPIPNMEDPFIDYYFNPRGNFRENGFHLETVEDRWASAGPPDSRKYQNAKASTRATLGERIERNDRWNDLVEHQIPPFPQTRRPASPYLSPLTGIDHYHGSPQLPSRNKALPISRPSAFHGGNVNNSATSYSQPSQRPLYTPASQRCGPSCYSVRLELENYKIQLQECIKQRDQYHKLLFEFDHRLKLVYAQNQRLLESLQTGHEASLQYQTSPDSAKCSTESPAIVDTATRLEHFYQQYLQHAGSQFRGVSPETFSSKDDQYFKSEFEMFFRSLKCWADRYLKFPNQATLPPELEESLKEVCQREDYVVSLIETDRTKSVVVQGIVSRLIADAILNGSFLKNLPSIDDENVS